MTTTDWSDQAERLRVRNVVLENRNGWLETRVADLQRELTAAQTELNSARVRPTAEERSLSDEVAELNQRILDLTLLVSIENPPEPVPAWIPTRDQVLAGIRILRNTLLRERDEARILAGELAARISDAVRERAEAIRERAEAIRMRDAALSARDRALAETPDWLRKDRERLIAERVRWTAADFLVARGGVEDPPGTGNV